MREHIISIDGLFDKTGIGPNTDTDPPVGQVIKEAELIFGRDVMSERLFLVYGADALKEILDKREARDMTEIIIELDQETGELERLCALVQTIKGHHDYERGGWKAQ